MFKMFNQFFSMLSMFFAGLEKFASAFNHLGGWGEETAAAFADEARVNRKAQMNALRAEHNLTEADVPDAAPVLEAPKKGNK